MHSQERHHTIYIGVFVSLTLLLAIILILCITPDSKGTSAPEPWLDDSRPVVSFLFSDKAMLSRLAADMDLDPAQLDSLRATAMEETQALAALKQESNAVVGRDDISEEQKSAAVENMGYNLRVRDIVSASRAKVEAVLEPDQIAAMPTWVSARLAEQRQQFAAAAMAAGPDSPMASVSGSYRIYATQYYSNYGADSVDVAVPDKYVKFASLGWEYHSGYPAGGNYSVNLGYNGRQLNGVRVKDCGPWNIDDNYWNTTGGSRPRRVFGGLATGMPEAQAAYFDGYNGGRDQFGRLVSNPAGIDLSPAAGVQLGLGYLVSGWITVSFNWEEGTPIYGAIRDKYMRLGGAPGTPLNSEYDVPGGRAQDFSQGRLIYNATSGQVYWVMGGILWKYDQLGGPGGFLGQPLSDEMGVIGGRVSSFQGGRIYWSDAYGAKAVYGTILTKYDATGGTVGAGMPVEEEHAAGSGRVAVFEREDIYWSPQTGAKQVLGAVRFKYNAMGGPGILGLPTSDEFAVSGGRANSFQAGRIYWSSQTGAHYVLGGIMAKYDQLGGPDSLGLPKTDETTPPGDAAARMNDFSYGQIYWSPQSGATAVFGSILGRYESLGGVEVLGIPTSDETAVPGIPGARVSNFSRGRIYWSPQTGAREIYGGILGKYVEMGGPGTLGLPVTGEHDVPGGRASDLQFGSIYWTPEYGSHMVVGAIKAKFDSMGGIDGFGPPVADEAAVPGAAGARVSEFSGGRIYWVAAYGAHPVYGAILDKYLASGGAASLGIPTNDEMEVDGYPDARVGVFSSGRIYWSPQTGAKLVYGAILAGYLRIGGPDSPLGLVASDEYAIPGGRRSDFQGGYITWSYNGELQVVTD